jgi:hypothetical protein
MTGFVDSWLPSGPYHHPSDCARQRQHTDKMGRDMRMNVGWGQWLWMPPYQVAEGNKTNPSMGWSGKAPDIGEGDSRMQEYRG